MEYEKIEVLDEFKISLAGLNQKFNISLQLPNSPKFEKKRSHKKYFGSLKLVSTCDIIKEYDKFKISYNDDYIELKRKRL